VAKGQHFTAHQRKIIDRYYEHRDTIALNKLSEIVSDLYLCTSEKKAAGLWKSAATALKNAGANPVQSANVLQARDVQALARLVSELQTPSRRP
jgi:hypothetical protein